MPTTKSIFGRYPDDSDTFIAHTSHYRRRRCTHILHSQQGQHKISTLGSITFNKGRHSNAYLLEEANQAYLSLISALNDAFDPFRCGGDGDGGGCVVGVD